MRSDEIRPVDYGADFWVRFGAVWRDGRASAHESLNFMLEFGGVVCDFSDGCQFVRSARRFPYPTIEKSGEISVLCAACFDIAVALSEYMVESVEPLNVAFCIGDSGFSVRCRR